MSLTSDDTPKKQNKGRKADRVDPQRFEEPGINYKGKFIGIEDVPEPRGDKMCQVAMAKLKAAVKTLGDHKQKIIVNVSLQGVRIIDEKSELLVHFHPVHRISFISRDPNDSRAFGYVYGSASGSHQFYGIKTEKVAEGVVICLRDLFQVVFEMKKQGSECNRNCLPTEDQFLEQRPSPKLGSSRTAWLKTDYWSQSVGMSPSEPYRGSVTPGSIKKETSATSKTRCSPLLLTSANSSLKQNSFAGQVCRTSMTPEPIYQNASVLSSKLMQSTITSATLPHHASAIAESGGSSGGKSVKSGKLQRTRLSDGDREWVSFEFDDADKFDIQSESRKNAVKKDPFANDPFFSRNLGCEEGEEIVVWTRDKVPTASEPTYGVFVEPNNVKDSSGHMTSNGKVDSADALKICQENLELYKNLSKLNPYQCSSKPSALFTDKHLNEQSTETQSDQESSSDLVSFPSPDAPPPPLPQDTLVLLTENAPILPPRPGSAFHHQSMKPPSTFQDESHFGECIPISNQHSLNDQITDTSRVFSIPKPPPRHNWSSEQLTEDDTVPRSGVQEAVYTSLTHKVGVSAAPVDHQKSNDPFAFALLKRSGNSEAVATSKQNSMEPLRSHIPHVADSVGAMLTSATSEWVNAHQEQICRGFSTSHYQNTELQDPFLHQDPFVSKGFPADQNTDPFGKFLADSPSFQTHAAKSDGCSGAFDNVFTSRDELYEKMLNNGNSPATVDVINNRKENGGTVSDLSSLSCPLRDVDVCSTGSKTQNDSGVFGIESKTNVVFKDSENFTRERKLEQQSSFDSVLNDFAQRFPPVDDGWTTFSPDGPSQFSQLQQNDQVPALQSDNNKSRLIVPKSSDSSSNSEIAEAFCEEQNYFFNC